MGAGSDITRRCVCPVSTHLVAVAVHGHQAQQMVHVATLAKLAHQLGLEALVLQEALVAGGHKQPLHADGAILQEPKRTSGLQPAAPASLRRAPAPPNPDTQFLPRLATL